jgi:Alanine-zipper, major outer membrane lipoprotein
MLMRRIALVVVPVVALGACTTTLSDQDRALLTAASQNAEQAKQQSAQALAAAQAAQTSAAQAAADAKSANEKADRIFQNSLRK